ncbi:MAG TPA: hypothetical protein VFB58_13440 [Chloroflexota bacterium]|nr:hypothetical protein [Chloroflexota bacterium]
MRVILFIRILPRDEGQNMVEYALLAALLAVATVGVLLMVGPGLHSAYATVTNGLALVSQQVASASHAGCPVPDPVHNPHCR